MAGRGDRHDRTFRFLSSVVSEENTLQGQVSAPRKMRASVIFVTVHRRGYEYADPESTVTTTEAMSLPGAARAEGAEWSRNLQRPTECFSAYDHWLRVRSHPLMPGPPAGVSRRYFVFPATLSLSSSISA